MKSMIWSWRVVLSISLIAFWFSIGTGLGKILSTEVSVGEKVNIAYSGKALSGDNFVGLQWDSPREVYEVRIAGVNARLSDSLWLEWWASVWPDNGSGGWMRLDDPWNGQWVRINIKPKPDKSGQCVFKFPPLTRKEWQRALKSNEYPDKQEPLFRRTLKVRVVAESGVIPAQSQLSVFGNSRWKEASFDIETKFSHAGQVSGRIELVNGVLLSLQSLPAPQSVEVNRTGWRTQGVAGNSAGVRIRILYADNKDFNSNDLTRVTVRMGRNLRSTGFSFLPQDVLAEGIIRLPDFSTIVSKTSQRLTLANDPRPPRDKWLRPVRGRIQSRPEMTRKMAMKGIPRLSPLRWIPLGVPSARQEFFAGPNGDWMVWALSLNTDKGRDAKRWGFSKNFNKERQWDKFFAMLDTRKQPKFDGGDRDEVQRYLEAGYLPLTHVEWRSGPLCYHHTLMTTILLGDYGDDISRRGDETVVLLSKLAVNNTTNKQQLATLNLRYSNNAPIALQDDGMITVKPADRTAVPTELFPLRGLISMDSPSDGGAAGWTMLPNDDPKSSEILRWQTTVKPNETRSIYFKTPFVELLDAKELARLKTISFEKEVQRVLNYWQRRLAQGMQISVPDKAVNNFYKANLWHNVITTDRDPETGFYNQGVATVRYRVFANETVMIARSMDMRGEHLEAERFLEPMLHYQGHEPLKGRFSTRDGVFHSAGDYTHGEYAMNHGFVLWGVADHYLLSRDKAYLDRVAPQLIKGCDFLISERATTMGQPGEHRSLIHGLSPASSLEDVVEYQYWFTTNAYFYLGMKRVAEALADIEHPESQRIATEAERYRRDIETSIRETTTMSAVVPLRDGNYIPYVPSRVYQWRHLTEGWIREALYCSLHLATAEVLPYDDPLITWMLDDLEDNIFFSWQSGYNVSDYEQSWFERGAVTLQPCLLDTTIVYMARDEIAAALRSFWNTYALLIYPDAQCFAEWARRFGVGGGPVYKTSDESRFVMWLRQLLVWENGDWLWFGRATPREWLEDGKTIRIERAQTKFGTAGMVIRSEVNKGRIYAEVSLPKRNPPAEIWLRLRHPQGLQPSRVFINDLPIEPERIVGADIQLMPGIKDLSLPVRVMSQY